MSIECIVHIHFQEDTRITVSRPRLIPKSSDLQQQANHKQIHVFFWHSSLAPHPVCALDLQALALGAPGLAPGGKCRHTKVYSSATNRIVYFLKLLPSPFSNFVFLFLVTSTWHPSFVFGLGCERGVGVCAGTKRNIKARRTGLGR